MKYYLDYFKTICQDYTQKYVSSTFDDILYMASTRVMVCQCNTSIQANSDELSWTENLLRFFRKFFGG